MVIILNRQKLIVVVFAIFISLLSITTVATAEEVSVVRSISKSEIDAGDSFVVSIGITTNEELSMLGLKETIPEGWLVEKKDSDEFMYSDAANEWLWADFSSNVSSGTTSTIEYTVTVPGTTQSGQYEISGLVSGIKSQDNEGEKFSYTVSGDTQIVVSGTDDAISTGKYSSGDASGSSDSSLTKSSEGEDIDNTSLSSDNSVNAELSSEKLNSYEPDTVDVSSASASGDYKAGYDHMVLLSLFIICFSCLFFSMKKK